MRSDEYRFGDNDLYDARELIGEAQEIAKSVRDAQGRMIEKRFGHPLPYLIRHPQIVEAFANDPDPESRCNVLTFLAYYAAWPKARAQLLTAIKSDSAPNVRIVAACLIGEMYGNSGDRELLDVIKDVARDENEDNEVRKAAYLSVTRFDRDDNFIDPDTFEFPADADWEFLDRVIPLHDSPNGIVNSKSSPRRLPPGQR